MINHLADAAARWMMAHPRSIYAGMLFLGVMEMASLFVCNTAPELLRISVSGSCLGILVLGIWNLKSGEE